MRLGEQRQIAPRDVTPAVKLYQAGSHDNTAGGLSPAMSLFQFYEAFFKPVCLLALRKAPRNIKQYDESLDYWVRFTGDPPLEQINDLVIEKFQTQLGALPGKGKHAPPGSISDNTIRKHCTHLQAVLDRTGPRSSTVKRLRKAQGLIDFVPYLEKPPEREKPPEDSFTLEEITRILENCHAAPAPDYLAPPQRAAFWLNLFLADYNLGLRIGSVLVLEWTMLDGDWFNVPVKGGHIKRVRVNGFAHQAVNAMRPITGQHRCIWHWPHTEWWLQENRRRILRAAGIPLARQFGFHAIRKAMLTHAAPISVLGASLQAGHKDERTTIKHYIHPVVVAKTMDQLPQPKSPTPQKRLFE